MNVFELGEFHGLLVALTFLVIIYTDHQGYLYFRGKKQLLSEKFISWSHSIVWAGLLLIAFTGAMLFIPGWEYYLSEPVFVFKLCLVALLFINGIAIGSLAKKAATTPFAELTTREQKILMLSGAISFIGWVGAATIGAFIL